MARKCRTPGAIFHTSIMPGSAGCIVTLPSNVLLKLNVVGAKKLEGKIHDAMEDILAEFFK